MEFDRRSHVFAQIYRGIGSIPLKRFESLILTLLVAFSAQGCMQRKVYQAPALAEPFAILKLKFHDLNSIPGASVHTAVNLEGRHSGIFHEAIHETVSHSYDKSGDNQGIPLLQLAMDAGPVVPGPSNVRIQMEAHWEEERLEHLTYFDGNNWRQRLTRVSVQRKAGCSTELNVDVVQGSIYLLDFTWYSMGECQAIAYRQTFSAEGFSLQEVARSSNSESILDWPSTFRLGSEPWIWYPHRPQNYPSLP